MYYVYYNGNFLYYNCCFTNSLLSSTSNCRKTHQKAYGFLKFSTGDTLAQAPAHGGGRAESDDRMGARGEKLRLGPRITLIRHCSAIVNVYLAMDVGCV